jgi:hypothetical protein
VERKLIFDFTHRLYCQLRVITNYFGFQLLLLTYPTDAHYHVFSQVYIALANLISHLCADMRSPSYWFTIKTYLLLWIIHHIRLQMLQTSILCKQQNINEIQEISWNTPHTYKHGCTLESWAIMAAARTKSLHCLPCVALLALIRAYSHCTISRVWRYCRLLWPMTATDRYKRGYRPTETIKHATDAKN